MFSDRRKPDTPHNPERGTGERSPDRREFANVRLRTLMDRLFERLDELTQDVQEGRGSQTELAALLGRISAAIDLEVETCGCGQPATSPEGTCSECARELADYLEGKRTVPSVLSPNGRAPRG